MRQLLFAMALTGSLFVMTSGQTALAFQGKPLMCRVSMNQQVLAEGPLLEKTVLKLSQWSSVVVLNDQVSMTVQFVHAGNVVDAKEVDTTAGYKGIDETLLTNVHVECNSN